MRMLKVLTLLVGSTVMMAGMAHAQSTTSGTPDAQGGAVGRDQPSSLDGKGVRRSAGLTPRRSGMMMRHHRHHYYRHHHYRRYHTM